MIPDILALIDEIYKVNIQDHFQSLHIKYYQLKCYSLTGKFEHATTLHAAKSCTSEIE